MLLKDCSTCVVFTQKGHKLSDARVVHTKGSISLYFDNYMLKDMRFKSRVNFYDEQAGLITAICDTVIRRNPSFPEISEPWMADCDILEVKQVVQRQQDVRAKVDLTVTFKSSDGVEFRAMIDNLSAGGMYITTSYGLDKDEIISFNYAFRSLTREFKAITLWVKREKNGLYGYGCRFVNLTAGAESAIRSYVYKKLMEHHKKE